MDLNEEKIKADYNCPQGALYSGLEIAWNNFRDHQPAFLAENTKYSLDFEIPKLAEVKAASELPDDQAREADSEALRVKLVKIASAGLGFWNSLDGYVHNAFGPIQEYKARIEEAGKKYYEKAAEENWISADRLFVSAKNFINKYEVELTNSGGMPPTFKANFEAKIQEFDTNFLLFKTAESKAKSETATKLNANNLIYKKGRHMMEDGKHIFRDNYVIRELFVWESILATITSHRRPVDPPVPPVPPVV